MIYNFRVIISPSNGVPLSRGDRVCTFVDSHNSLEYKAINQKNLPELYFSRCVSITWKFLSTSIFQVFLYKNFNFYFLIVKELLATKMKKKYKDFFFNIFILFSTLYMIGIFSVLLLSKFLILISFIDIYLIYCY